MTNADRKWDTTRQVNWALQLLHEKGRSIGETFLAADGIIKTSIDGSALTVGEIIERASRYPEWPHRKRQHLDALRNE